MQARAASWLYDVVNVLIDSLEVEVSLLAKGNATWRFYNQQLEHIRPLNRYLSRDGHHIYRDLVMTHPEVATQLAPHDALCTRVEHAAKAVYREGLADSALRVAVEETRRTFLESHPAAVPTGAFPAEQHIDIVVEHLINEITEVAPHNTDAEFWRSQGPRFDFFKARAAAIPALRNARIALLDYDTTTVSWLQQFSFDICVKYDIPAAPSRAVAY